jgi:MoxR-like ATPase
VIVSTASTSLNAWRRNAAVAPSKTWRGWGDPLVSEALHDRAADNWRTLLAIADAAGGEWPKRARDAALALASLDDAESTRELLLRNLKALFDPVPADPKGIRQ